MKITFNDNEKLVASIRQGLLKRELHCPCRVDMTDDTICMCKEFREQVADPDFEGYCHCMLYYKSK